MDLEKLQKNYNELQNKYDNILKENSELKEHLKKYTAPERNKRYYQNHKEEVKKNVLEHRKKTGYLSSITPEKRKEYNKTAYEKRKQKLSENKN